ncbi:MAG TPA: type I-U CRISPR-associated helicase/endonuclease Cas3 [Burkholderiales bacterium]|nr:type I-U CRISPR-associated helicase/endonuclease Cas3 [Burkholderiales bacterium]
MQHLPPFTAWFRELWKHAPFRWQAMLAERVASGHWPQALDLPTASGKTACVDIAVYALAAQADRPLAERTAPLRIWFVVDRRIVVDEAFERAQKIAQKLADAESGPLRETADRLRQLSGTDRPLAVARLRGGILRDDGWARIPSQPAIITSTVDQLGSRLLFRGYGHSLLAAPIFAGLAANDSLIFLDEAHCAVPFMQTLRAIERYRGPKWAEEHIPTPFAFVVMSATPPAGIPLDQIFPGRERAEVLDDPELARRLRTSKRAQLIEVTAPRSRRSGEPQEAAAARMQADRAEAGADDPLVTEAVVRAGGFVRSGKLRVAVMVNRVRTAEAVADALRTALGEEADVVLLTGRIRPFERDELVERWTPYLRANRPEQPEKPVVVVSTQCLEVGADFSFDALVTECASLDALRQRFGRLARLGSEQPAPAAVLMRGQDAESVEPDPIYGTAIRETWKWLEGQAAETESGTKVVDFGVEALEVRVREIEDLSSLLAPAPDAPILLPAHLDLLCQTAPPPHPQPEVSLHLHGRAGPPEVSVVWRCDLAPDDPGTWTETIALCPPVSAEMLQAPLWRVRAWLAERPAADYEARAAASDEGDVEGAGEEPETRAAAIRRCLLWRGRDRSRVARTADDIAPGDVVVVPAAYGIAGLGQATKAKALGDEGLDLWEPARAGVGHPAAVRLHPAVLAPWLACSPLAELLAVATSRAWDREEVQDAIQAVLDYEPEGEDAPPKPPDWWVELLRRARHGRFEDHPAGGLVLVARATPGARRAAEPDLFADDDDLASAEDCEVTLGDHTASVARAAVKLAERCLPAGFRDAFELAARWHDSGKLDARFQLLLHHGDEVAAALSAQPLAKSASVPLSPARRRTIREASGLPANFRHEMLSLQLAERFAELPTDDALRDLVLHLVAVHHGHARPFAPVVDDPSPPGVSGPLGTVHIALGAEARAALVPSHRIDSGAPKRFWRLTRRYGWWGLAYLEAVFRLADWYGSVFVVRSDSNRESAPWSNAVSNSAA